MNIDQFIKLIDAYGAAIEHWPEVHQKQAYEIIKLNLTEVNKAFEQARLLDGVLSSHAIAPAERTLFDSIIASAPKADASSIKQSFWQQWDIKNWLGISGFIGTGLAGAIAGAFFVSIWTSGMLSESINGVSEASGTMAQFVDVGQEWS
ncbi:hypothetical protein [Methylotenera sp.]|uniref:hypothetical protein n=1 Tax=Methylotenera sp. TaxID=2051956 RepID=UPI002489D322|nr:hypothetical protein [Methylotenera sp.]MDI1298153.1 hypothetical protein [Methylotenera sp.]